MTVARRQHEPGRPDESAPDAQYQSQLHRHNFHSITCPLIDLPAYAEQALTQPRRNRVEFATRRHGKRQRQRLGLCWGKEVTSGASGSWDSREGRDRAQGKQQTSDQTDPYLNVVGKGPNKVRTGMTVRLMIILLFLLPAWDLRVPRSWIIIEPTVDRRNIAWPTCVQSCFAGRYLAPSLPSDGKVPNQGRGLI